MARRLDFIQNMEYKFVELLSCDFIASPEEVRSCSSGDTHNGL